MLLQLEDIEEFKFAHHIPRTAITEEILAGIRQLDERDELEPALRDIIHDTTQTPHNSAEHCDILTTHITYLNRPHLAAFINKGKSFTKVKEQGLSHQLFKVRRIAQVELMVLLAVGHIQDSARVNFIQAAADASADYLIIDACDVARLFIAYHKVCPRDGYPYVQGHCPQCQTPVDDPVELVLRVHEPLRYDISFQDNSHGTAKRYSADIVTDPHYTKAALREVIKRATWELRHETYQRSERLEHAFAGQESDCVFLFIYLDQKDKQQVNWVCRTLWIHSTLPKQSRPLQLGGNEWLGEIEIDWNAKYEQRRTYWMSRYETVGNWMTRVEDIFPRMERIVTETRTRWQAYQEGKIDVNALQSALRAFEEQARHLHDLSGRQALPPSQCHDCDQAFQQVVSMFGNIFIPFAAHSRANWDWNQKLKLFQRSLKGYEEDRATFIHEWYKLGRESKVIPRR